MNILPKKKWHVRTTENIARVRRDEAQAAEEERERERRRKLAEQEARTNLLRSRAREKLGHAPDNNQPLEDRQDPEIDAEGDGKKLGYGEESGDIESITNAAGHVNFFQNLENGEKLEEGNEENAAEKKREQEEYEKKVGYLTYLGQDTEELTGEKVWWRKAPDRHQNTDEEKRTDVGSKQKNFLDPLLELKKRLGLEHEPLTLKRHQDNKPTVQSLDNNKKTNGHLKRKRSRSSSSVSKHKKRKSKKRKRESSSSMSDRSSHKRKKRKSDKKQKKSTKNKKDSKKRRKSSKSSSDDESSSGDDKKKKKANLERLRRERLEREKRERNRANKVLYGEPKEEKPKEEAPKLKASYNSQFNPEIARQNKLDPNKKYWLQ